MGKTLILLKGIIQQEETNKWVSKTCLSNGYRLEPGALPQLKIKQQRNSQPRRTEKEPSMRQDVNEKKLRKKPEVWQMLLRDQVRWTENKWSLELAPRHHGRSHVGAVFSWVRIAVRWRRVEKRKGGEDVELVNIDISSHKCCCKRKQRMML